LAFAKNHFFVAPGFELEFEHKCEEIPWEIFRGRLLEPAHTRIRQEFESWNAYWVDDKRRSQEPILSMKLDVAGRQIQVVRAIHSYVWEAYDAGGNVIESRETTRWVRELVGTVHLDEFNNGNDLLDEINCLLFQAVVGATRLPLTTLENPLPAFTLGQLGYFPFVLLEGHRRQSSSFQDLIRSARAENLPQREKAKIQEAILRICPLDQISTAAELIVCHRRNFGHSPDELSALMEEVFNEVSLSPYSDFVAKAITFVGSLEHLGYWTIEHRVDFLCRLLRKLTRHLTAYDLKTFHHRGANYPDALLLDAVLRDYLKAVEAHPELFISVPSDPKSIETQKRRRRQVLRLDWLVRNWYQDLPVPEIPTSPGENMWVLPSTHPRMPDEMILEPGKRTKRLYENEKINLDKYPKAADLIAHSNADLIDPEELEEMGLAVFLDRPLGIHKSPGEPDRTPLLSYLAFSRFIAESRIRFLADLGLMKNKELKSVIENLGRLSLCGISPMAIDRKVRPGVISITDAARAAPDFIIRKTTRKSAAKFLGFFDFDELDPQVSSVNWPGGLPLLILQEKSPEVTPQAILTIYDFNYVKRLQLLVDASSGYSSRAGVELPRPGLRVLHAWDAYGAPVDVPNQLIQAV
jgi:hypothetical protein